MKISWLLGFFGLGFFASAAEVISKTGPEIQAIASFPEDNPFGQVVNGERNRINVYVENTSELNITLSSIAGSFHDVISGTSLKNTTAQPYSVPLFTGAKITVPYTFHSEFKPGEVRLTLWVEYIVNGLSKEKFRAIAFNNSVKIVEPEKSILDLQLISTYLILVGVLAAGAYFTYISFVPQKKRSSGPNPKVSRPINPLTPTPGSQGQYEEEWIPEHHLRKTKKDGALSSGDEAVSSGAEKKKKKRG